MSTRNSWFGQSSSYPLLNNELLIEVVSLFTTATILWELSCCKMYVICTEHYAPNYMCQHNASRNSGVTRHHSNHSNNKLGCHLVDTPTISIIVPKVLHRDAPISPWPLITDYLLFDELIGWNGNPLPINFDDHVQGVIITVPNVLHSDVPISLWPLITNYLLFDELIDRNRNPMPINFDDHVQGISIIIPNVLHSDVPISSWPLITDYLLFDELIGQNGNPMQINFDDHVQGVLYKKYTDY